MADESRVPISDDLVLEEHSDLFPDVDHAEPGVAPLATDPTAMDTAVEAVHALMEAHDESFRTLKAELMRKLNQLYEQGRPRTDFVVEDGVIELLTLIVGSVPDRIDVPTTE